MRKLFMGLALAILVLAQPLQAHASTALGQVVNGLNASPVYAEAGSALTEVEALEAALADTEVAAVSFGPTSSVDTVNPSGVAKQLLEQVDYSTVVVVGSNGVFAVASEGDAAAIATALNEARYESGDDPSTVLMNEVSSIAATQEETSTEGFDAFLLIVPLAIALLVGVFIMVRLVTPSGRRAPKSLPANTRSGAVPAAGKTLPVAMREGFERLRKLHGAHRSLLTTRANSPREEQLLLQSSAGIEKFTTTLNELFKRLVRKGTQVQLDMATTEYTRILEKLQSILGEGNFLDIIIHPDYWNNRDERLDQVLAALTAVNKQAIENIQQVNASRDLEFQAALETLNRAAEQVSIDDIYNTK